jgi:hypothetical protein
MLTFTIDDSSIKGLKEAFKQIGLGNLLPNTQKAVNMTAASAAQMWKNWAMGGSINGIPRNKRPSGKLAQSIDYESLGNLEARAFSTSEEFEKIKSGYPDIHMKDINSPWLKSKRTRVAKKNGQEYPYLIIPFSWRTRGGSQAKNVVPMNIVEILRKGVVSTVLNSADPEKLERNRYGELIPRASYQWGTRITDDDVTSENGYESGMVRMWDSAFKNSVHGTYFTFRVLSPYSRARWIIKGQEGIDVTKRIEEIIKPEFEKAVAEGIKADLNI